MSYLNKMYGRTNSNNSQAQAASKNPNRVTGGLKAQGVDTVVMLGEDGSQQEVPSLAYVRSLEEQLKKTRAAINVLERKQARDNRTIEQLVNQINSR